MKFATKETGSSANGIACLAIVKMLLEIMQKKSILSEEEIDIIVRQKVNVYFIRDKNLKEPIKPLYATSAYVMVSLEENEFYYNVQ